MQRKCWWQSQTVTCATAELIMSQKWYEIKTFLTYEIVSWSINAISNYREWPLEVILAIYAWHYSIVWLLLHISLIKLYWSHLNHGALPQASWGCQWCHCGLSCVNRCLCVLFDAWLNFSFQQSCVFVFFSCCFALCFLTAFATCFYRAPTNYTNNIANDLD